MSALDDEADLLLPLRFGRHAMARWKRQQRDSRRRAPRGRWRWLRWARHTRQQPVLKAEDVGVRGCQCGRSGRRRCASFNCRSPDLIPELRGHAKGALEAQLLDAFQEGIGACQESPARIAVGQAHAQGTPRLRSCELAGYAPPDSTAKLPSGFAPPRFHTFTCIVS